MERKTFNQSQIKQFEKLITKYKRYALLCRTRAIKYKTDQSKKWVLESKAHGIEGIITELEKILKNL